jgi:5-(carboxyamino)imidazole ribonucleotide mutase
LLLTLQLFAARLTDPGYRAEGFRQNQQSLDMIYGTVANTPTGPIATEVANLIANGDPRFGLPPKPLIMTRTLDEVRQHAADMLDSLGVAYDKRVVSAHRTPQRLYDFATTAKAQGFKVIIAGAGGAEHLPGMAASMTELPVLGVPVESKALKGLDSLLSIAQMPGGIPVGTLAIGKVGATNAGLLAAAILALSDEKLAKKLENWRKKQTDSIAQRP